MVFGYSHRFNDTCPKISKNSFLDVYYKNLNRNSKRIPSSLLQGIFNIKQKSG